MNTRLMRPVHHISSISLRWFLLGMLLLWLWVYPITAQAESTVWTEPLRNAVLTFDPQARFRGDGLVTFANGQQYALAVPAQPNDDATAPIQITHKTADVIDFSNGYFLLHLIHLSNGRQSFPILTGDIPLTYKTALLAQDFNFPAGFLIPTMWKSLTGDLLSTPTETSTAEMPHFPLVFLSQSAPGQNQTAVFWDVAKGQLQKQIPLPCDQEILQVSHDGTAIFLGCHTQPILTILHLLDGTLQNITLPSL